MKGKMFMFVSYLSVMSVLSTPPSWAENPKQDLQSPEIEAVSPDVPEPVPLLVTPSIEIPKAETRRGFSPSTARETDEAAQEAADTDVQLLEWLFEAEGTVIAEGQNTQRVGALQLQSYRLEEIQLPQPRQVKVRGEDTVAYTAWRLTVTGGPFPVRAMPMVIWVGDTALSPVQQSPDLSEVSAVTFDESLFSIKDAPIAVSYGERGHRALLPEKLTLSDTRR